MHYAHLKLDDDKLLIGGDGSSLGQYCAVGIYANNEDASKLLIGKNVEIIGSLKNTGQVVN